MRGFAPLFLAGLALQAGCGGTEGPRAARDVVLLVTVDDLRRDHLACYGYEHDGTPNLTRLAAQGVVLADVVTVSTSRSAALASIHTGLAPLEHGLLSVGEPGARRLGPGLPRLAQRWRAAGGRTLAAVSNGRLVDRRTGFGEGFEAFLDRDLSPDGASLAADRVVERLLAGLDGIEPGPAPLFLWAHLGPVEVACPDPTTEELALLRERLRPHAAELPELAPFLADAPTEGDAVKELEGRIGRKRGMPLWRAWRMALYDLAVARVDRALGRLVEGLERRGCRITRSVVVGTRGRTVAEDRPDGEVEGFSEGLIRVPCIATGIARENAPVEHLLSVAAVFALLDPAGAHAPEGTGSVLLRRGATSSVAWVSADWKHLADDGPARWVRRSDDEPAAAEEVPAPVRELVPAPQEHDFALALRLGDAAEERRTWELDLRPVRGDLRPVPSSSDSRAVFSGPRRLRVTGPALGHDEPDLVVPTSAARASFLLSLATDGERPREDELALELADGRRIPLAGVPIPRAPSRTARARPWEDERDGQPAVDVTREGADRFRVLVAGSGEARLCLAAVSDAEEPLALEARTELERRSDPHLEGVALLVGPAPLEVLARVPPGCDLALFAERDGAPVPVDGVRYLGRRFAGDALELYFPARLPDELDEWMRAAGFAAPAASPRGASASISVRRRWGLGPPPAASSALPAGDVAFLRRMAHDE